MGKQKIGTLNGKPIVVGDKNIVTDNEIWAKISEDGNLIAIDELVSESPTPTVDKDLIAVFYNGTSIGAPSPVVNLGTGELVYIIQQVSWENYADPVSSISKENNTSYIEMNTTWIHGNQARVHFQMGIWLPTSPIQAKYGVAQCDKNQYKTIEVKTQSIDLLSLMDTGISLPKDGYEVKDGVIVLEFYNCPNGITPDPTPFYTYRIYVSDDV